MHTSQAVDKIVLGQHDFPNTREQLRLMLFHPEQLGRCKAGKRDVSRALSFSQKNGRAQHRVRFIQRNKAVHLAAHAHAAHLPRVKAGQQLRHALPARRPPIPGVLLAPARMWEAERIFFETVFRTQPFSSTRRSLQAEVPRSIPIYSIDTPPVVSFLVYAAAPCSL